MGNVMIMRRGGMDVSDATAIESNVLSGKTFYAGNNNDIRTGTMVNRGNISQSLNAGGSYTIPAGYHSGSGKITANSLSSQTQGTATAADIMSGKTTWVSGSKITGTMTNRGSVTQSLNAGGSYTIPAGYHSGSGKITANSLSSQTQGTATAADIEEGKIAWVNGSKITGTRPPSRLSESGTITENYADTPSASVYLSRKYIASDILETRIKLGGSHRLRGNVTLEAIYIRGNLSSITGDMQGLARITISSSNITIFIESGFYTAGYSIEAIRGF